MSDNQTPATQADSAIDNATEHTTHFGFKQVDKGQKASLVANVFDSVAAKYFALAIKYWILPVVLAI